MGSIYVYQVYDQVFEIDREMTKVPRASLETILYAAHKLGKKVACRVVAPKTHRNGRSASDETQNDLRQPAHDTGQMKLLL